MNRHINPRHTPAVAPALSTKNGAAAALARRRRALAELEQATKAAAPAPRPAVEQLTSPDIERYRRLLDEAITAEIRRRLGDAYCGDE